ncbi:MotA/TolQ/ExbB proton channel family protein [Arsenicitalea aurantiaca]|uniref:MotA/TolQ/ExbB proton channel family protein n=1 Tax=Arsenicitalea aurantiaca TaxID=1783274 RepID=A0A433XKI5_9HYPH|nr:MotA/TolQ/ExbB proton channel family protein [Arsenicitalea aurantiaca]RUT34579.1 MotA/TolQ/ExbB proton channel family protein [Arsenicitalea aurantiaca]
MSSFGSELFVQLTAILALGGPVVALLIALSVIAVALILIKLVQFVGAGVGRWGRAREALELWRAGRRGEALGAAQRDRSSVGAALAQGMALRLEGAEPARVESEMARIATGRLHELQKGFRALDAIAQISPLLGLFGTVLGMIEAFQAMQGAGAAIDPSVLAGGIWVALLTTAVGLGVAMPVSVVLTLLETRVDNERVALEAIVTEWQNLPAHSDERSGRMAGTRTAPIVAGDFAHAH